MVFLKLIDCLDIVFRKFSTSNLRFGCLERLVFQTPDNIAKHIILNFLNFYANGIKTKLSKHCLQLNYLSKILYFSGICYLASGILDIHSKTLDQIQVNMLPQSFFRQRCNDLHVFFFDRMLEMQFVCMQINRSIRVCSF